MSQIRRLKRDIDDIRRESRNEIDRLRMQQKQEIARMNQQNLANQEALVRKQQQEIEKLNRQMDLTQEQLNRQLREMQERHRREMEDARSEARAAIQKVYDDLQAKIKAQWEAVHKEVEQLQEQLAAMAENDKDAANEMLQEAMEAVEAVKKDQNVTDFISEQEVNYLVDQFNGIQTEMNQQLWAAAMAKAENTRMSADLTRFQAAECRREWDDRMKEVTGHIKQLIEQLKGYQLEGSCERKSRDFSTLDDGFESRLWEWNSHEFEPLLADLVAKQDRINQGPGKCPMRDLLTFYMDLHDWQLKIQQTRDAAYGYAMQLVVLYQCCAIISDVMWNQALWQHIDGTWKLPDLQENSPRHDECSFRMSSNDPDWTHTVLKVRISVSQQAPRIQLVICNEADEEVQKRSLSDWVSAIIQYAARDFPGFSLKAGNFFTDANGDAGINIMMGGQDNLIMAADVPAPRASEAAVAPNGETGPEPVST